MLEFSPGSTHDQDLEAYAETLESTAIIYRRLEIHVIPGVIPYVIRQVNFTMPKVYINCMVMLRACRVFTRNSLPWQSRPAVERMLSAGCSYRFRAYASYSWSLVEVLNDYTCIRLPILE